MARLLDKCWISACAALAFSVVSAAAVQDDFESTDTGSTPTGWTGNGTVAAEEYTYTKAVGLPLTDEGQAHTKTLAVSGQAVRTYGEDTATGESVTVDMMVKIMAADDVPDAPDTTSDIQVAIATGPVADDATVAPIYIYKGTTTDDGTTYDWEDTGKSYETNSWVRLMMVMDYDNNACKVTIDGDLIGTVNFPGTSLTASKKVSSITVEGLTSLDDVVVTGNEKSASALDPFPEKATSETATVGTDSVPVKLNWLYKNGIDGDVSKVMETKCSDESGMTYAQKYEAGLDIDDKQKFEVSSMSITEAKSAVFTVPGKADSYSVVIDSDGTTTTVIPTTSTENGVTTATVDLSQVTGKVIKFQLKAKAVDPNASSN